MSSVTVLINSESNIQLFKNMNKCIVDGYKRKGIIPNMAEHKQAFEETYGVEISYGRSNFWKHMIFPTEQDYTMAMLKWL